ncbi:RNA polymerase subunit sigma-24 [Devosia insulae DS-56]|uniref:RNA polymerase subunit sigma-24 n=1 Tax=Devosia insulae DS-56 TaxID=1116389 RepID=A0A1E5XTS2_9HYPH|nr:RNA polymerase subunit sigma-24 [Devosia insulae DS-56]
MVDRTTIEAVYRHEAGRVLATLIRLVGDFELAEEGAQDAFEAALIRWPQTGLPDNPRAWLVNTGRHKAIDRIRRRVTLRGKLRTLAAESAIAAQPDVEDIEDDRLRLIFTCCHPALALETRVALTLRTVCGLSTAAVASIFLVSEETMAQRLVRAKSKIREAAIPYQVPDREHLAERLAGVLAVVYLVFTEGYAPSAGTAITRPELCAEAIRLGRLLDQLLPGEPEISGLLALMLLHAARLDGRSDGAGELLLLEEQDRARWDRPAIAEGKALVERALAQPGRIGPYGVQAAIAALHADAPNFAATDWAQISGLYQVLLRLQPSPVVELNAAAALSMVDGPERALQLVEALAANGALDGYWPLHAARADLLDRLGRAAEAQAAYARALPLVRLEAERRLLERKMRG